MILFLIKLYNRLRGRRTIVISNMGMTGPDKRMKPISTRVLSVPKDRVEAVVNQVVRTCSVLSMEVARATGCPDSRIVNCTQVDPEADELKRVGYYNPDEPTEPHTIHTG